MERVPNTGIVNIEYTIVWAYNGGFCDHHEADITSVVIDYDSGVDRLNRVSYSVHGYALEEFDVQHWSGLKTAFPDLVLAARSAAAGLPLHRWRSLQYTSRFGVATGDFGGR